MTAAMINQDGVVVNMILVAEGDTGRMEAITGLRVVEAPDALGVMIGDSYDADDGKFYRGGQTLTTLMANQIRRGLLSECDYTQVLDYPCSDEERQGWLEYRQALRDLTGHPNWPELEPEDWPQAPGHAGGGDSMQQVIDTMLGGGGDG